MRTYSPSLPFSPSLVVAFDAVVTQDSFLLHIHLVFASTSGLCYKQRERETVSGAVLENAFERELKMKDTRQIGKIAYKFLFLFSLFLCLLTILVTTTLGTTTLCIRHRRMQRLCHFAEAKWQMVQRHSVQQQSVQ